MKKIYSIRPNSPADYIIRSLPYIGVIAVLALAGIMTSWDLGIL